MSFLVAQPIVILSFAEAILFSSLVTISALVVLNIVKKAQAKKEMVS